MKVTYVHTERVDLVIDPSDSFERISLSPKVFEEIFRSIRYQESLTRGSLLLLQNVQRLFIEHPELLTVPVIEVSHDLENFLNDLDEV